MTLRTEAQRLDPELIGGWPFQAQAPFMRSAQADVLRRELDRYVKGQTPGRSFLVSGDRGIGKTTLVDRAVEDVVRQAHAEAAAQATTRSAAPFVRPRRPLIVRVHGPTLSELLGPTTPERAGPPEADAKPAPEPPRQDVASVLGQITVALYRTLAAEVSACFARHACDGTPGSSPDRAELAGQFLLDLDRAPDPATLREYWARLDATAPGVLWPPMVGRALVARGISDQGVRELAAVATMAQAFQVCSGAVKYSQTEKRSTSREATSEAKAGVDLKDALGRAASLAVGAAVAVPGVVGGAPVRSVLAGAAASALTALALSASAKSSRKRESASDYAFIRDRSLATLDRDLPVAIGRLRDAGLAPVFVIDEIDKVPDPEALIRGVIGRLKHMTTDYGFFCFVTDLGYYEGLQMRLRDGSFPVDHTYFTDWLRIQYKPEDLVAFVSDLLTSDAEQGSATAERDAEALAVLSRVIVQRSRLNTVDVVRQVSRLCDHDGAVRATSDQIVATLRYRLSVAMQLCIEHVLSATSTAERVDEDPTYAQLLMEALYRLSREWANGADQVAVDPDAVVADLRRRERADAPSTPARPPSLRGSLPEADAASIAAAVTRACDLMCGFAAFSAELRASRGGGLAAVLDGLGLDPIAGLMRKVDGATAYAFVFDHHGREVETRAATSSERPIPPSVRDRARSLSSTVSGMADALTAMGLSVPDLVTGGLLPRTSAWSEVSAANRRVEAALEADRGYDELSSDLPSLASFVKASARAWPNVDLVTTTAARLGGREPAALAATLARLAWYLDLGRQDEVEALRTSAARLPSAPDPAPTPPRLDPEALASWRERVRASSTAGTGTPPATSAGAVVLDWDEAKQAARRHFLDGRPPGQSTRTELILAARGEGRSSLLRHDLARMTMLDWTLVLLRSFPRRDTPASPLWTRSVALFALGFGRAILASACEPADAATWRAHPSSPDPGLDLAQDLVRAASDAPPGLAFVSVNDWTARQLPVGTTSTPVLPLSQTQIREYGNALEWLERHGALQGVIHQQGGEGA